MNEMSNEIRWQLIRMLGLIGSMLELDIVGPYSTEELSQLWLLPNDIADLLKILNNVKLQLMPFEELKKYERHVQEQIQEIINVRNKYSKQLNNYKTPDGMLALFKNRDEFMTFYELTNALIAPLNNIRAVLQQMLGELDLISSNLRFQGRGSQPILRQIDLLHDEIMRAVASIERIQRCLYEMRNRVIKSIRKIWEHDILIPNDVHYVLSQFKAKMESRGMWAKDVIDIVIGLESFTGKPITDFVQLPQELESEPIDTRRLFYAYPPFEPIVRKDGEIVSIDGVRIPITGCYVWFIDCENFDERTKRKLEKLLERILEKESIGLYDKIKLVNPIRIIDEGELKIYIWCDRRPVRIKYGSGELVKVIRECKAYLRGKEPDDAEKLVQKIYEERLKREYGGRRRPYKATDFSYVWYCVLGYAMSTDPWDLNCPFTSECKIFRQISKKRRRCPLWSYSRRLFPKVLCEVHRDIPVRALQPEESYGFLIPLKGRGVAIWEIFKGVQWYMPGPLGRGRPVYVEFSKGIIRVLPKTNVVGFAIPYALIEALCTELLDPNVKPKPPVRIAIGMAHQTCGLDSLILTKYFVWSRSEYGRRLYRLFEQSKERLLKQYKEFLDKFYEWNGRDIIEFTTELLSHTLAHMLQQFLSKELEIEEESLLYLSLCRDEAIYVLIAENSPLGVIDIIGHVERKFGTVREMVRKFIDFLHSYLCDHEEEIIEYIGHIRSVANNIEERVKELIKVMHEYYMDFIREDFIIDLHNYILHFILSRSYEMIAKELNISPSQVLSDLDHIIEMAGPSYCIDGCTSCVMFERGCTEPILQHVLTSKHLLKWFLSLLSEGLELTAQGGRFGGSLLRTLPKQKLFVITPYIDEDGARLLRELHEKGVKVILITRGDTFDKFANILSGIDVKYIIEHRHDKMYIIDDRLLIDTTWNLLIKSTKLERFKIKLISPSHAVYLMRQMLKNAEGTRVNRHD